MSAHLERKNKHAPTTSARPVPQLDYTPEQTDWPLLGSAQSKGQILHMQSLVGNQAVMRLLARNADTPNQTAFTPLPQVQLKPPATPTKEDVAEYEEMRKRFGEAQKEYFAEVGKVIEEQVFSKAGFKAGEKPKTTDEALKVVALWGLSIDKLKTQLPEIGASLAGAVTSQQTDQGLDTQQQQLIDALTPDGQSAYKQMMQTVKAEAFWQKYLEKQTVYVFPDLSGNKRYAGYMQKGKNTETQQPVYIIHVSKDMLNAGKVQEVAASLVHELSHTAYEPGVLRQSMDSMNEGLAELIADHPDIQKLRSKATDPDDARAQHVRKLKQLFYEATGYAEGEIFVHLQQLTHMPSEIDVTGGKARSSEYIIAIVEAYIKQIKRIGLSPQMQKGILNSIKERTKALYDRRIAAAPKNSKERKLLEINKDMALSILELAQSS